MLTIISALFGGLFKKLLAIAANIPAKAWYALGIVLALLFAWHVHTGWEKSAHARAYAEGVAAEKVNTNAEIAKNAINLASIAEMERNLAAKNAESDARAKALTDSKTQDAGDVARANAAQKADAVRRGALEGIRDGAAAKPACKVPDALTNALEGL